VCERVCVRVHVCVFVLYVCERVCERVCVRACVRVGGGAWQAEVVNAFLHLLPILQSCANRWKLPH
jgi:hypothetical protein